MRRLLSTFAFLGALAASPSAHALGALAARPPEMSFASSADVAVAVTPEHVTTWARTRFEGAADAVAWLVAVPPGAAVDVASPSWLDALDDATAPRILAPAKKPEGAACDVPAPSLVSSGDGGVPAPLAGFALVDDVSALGATLGGWGFAPHALDDAAKQALGEGQRLLVLHLSAAEGVTPTLRIHAPAGTAPRMLAKTQTPEPYTLFLLGDGRAFVAGGVESVVAPWTIAWTSPSSTTYASARDALLVDAQHTVVEMAGPAAAHSVDLPVSGAVPGLVDAFLGRVGGPAAADLVATVQGALAKPGSLPEACPRGDLVPAGPCAASPSPLDAGPLAAADDLRFAFAGTPASRWMTRLAAASAPGTTCHAMGPSFGTGPAISAAVGAGAWGPLCKQPAPPTGVSNPPAQGGGAAPLPPDDPTAEETATPAGDPPPAAIVSAAVDMGCSCSSDTTGEGDGHSSGCSGDSSGSSSQSSGCSSSSSGSSSESSGCSSGSSGSSDSSGCSSSSGGSSTCSVTGRPVQPLRLSRLMILLAAVVLPVRRAMRPRKTEKRTSRV